MPSLEDERLTGVEDAALSAEEIQRRAYEEGFASGEKAGYAAGEQKALLLAERLEKIIGEITEIKAGLVEELESQAVELSTAIAKKIITEEIRTRPEVIVTIVKESLKRLQRTGVITIRINPALQELFMKKKPELIDIHQDIAFDVISNIPVTAPLVISKTEEVVMDIDSLFANVMEEIKKAAEKQKRVKR